MRRGILALSISLLLLSILLGLVFGSVPLKRILSKDMFDTVVMKIRLPRVVMAGVSGAVLATVGVVFQGILKNPLVDPYLIGVSAGASFGAVFSMSMAEIFGPVWLDLSPILAFSFSLFSSFLVLIVSRRGGSLPATEVILSGVAISMVFNSAMIVVSYFFRRSVQGISTWIFGNLTGCVWKDVPFPTMGLTLFLFVSLALSFKLDAMGFGEEFAKASGVETDRIKFILFTTGILATSLVVSKVGSIGFVGLIIPHISRILMGSSHRVSILTSCIFGASFLILTDLISRTLIPPLEIPIGVITSFFGVPVFIVLMKRRGTRW